MHLRPFNPLLNLAGYQLRRASAINMDALAKELAPIGLRPTTASILLLVGANPSITPSDAGRELGIQRANMTPLLATLEKDGFIERRALNGRSHGLVLTPEGERTELQALQAMWRSDQKILSRLQTAEQSSFIYMLSRLWVEEEAEAAQKGAPDSLADPGEPS